MNHENSDKKKIADELANINFEMIKFGDGYNFLVNRTPEKFAKMDNFGDVQPLHNAEYNLHMKLTEKNSSKTSIITLNDLAASTMNIPGSSKMSNEEYYQAYAKFRGDHVNHLVSKTYAKGYEYPSPIQSIACPEIIQFKDCIIQSKSGTGKTHAVTFGLLWHFDLGNKNLQYIFITSSHEVATQIHSHVKCLLPETAKVVLCIGQKKNTPGTGGFKNPIKTSSLNDRQKSIQEIREEVQNAQIIVCTMGKLYDFMFNRKFFQITPHLKAICVDEFDNIVVSRSRQQHTGGMPSTEQQLEKIISTIDNMVDEENRRFGNDFVRVQRIFCSATISNESLEKAYGYCGAYSMRIGEPLVVLLDLTDYTLKGIKQYYVECKDYSWKQDVCIDLLKQLRIAQAIIFTNKKNTAIDLYRLLLNAKLPIASSCAIFHGDLEAKERDRIYKDFSESKIRLLISTDVTARGLDVQGINVVINFDMPEQFSTYVHRVGRSGRYGRKGVAISLITVNEHEDEREKLREIDYSSEQSKTEELPDNLSTLL